MSGRKTSGASREKSAAVTADGAKRRAAEDALLKENASRRATNKKADSASAGSRKG